MREISNFDRKIKKLRFAQLQNLTQPRRPQISSVEFREKFFHFPMAEGEIRAANAVNLILRPISKRDVGRTLQIGGLSPLEIVRQSSTS